ncbi:MAG: Mur ligase domain-containing protein, partial [Longimicrobiales bacterium]
MTGALPFAIARSLPVPLSAVTARLIRDGLLLNAPDRDVELHGVSDDSRDVSPGDLFCAWRGVVSDAHAYVPAAASAGAAAALVERPVSDA